MVRPILRGEFFHDGRGPELVKVHYRGRGSTIAAADYTNPGDPGLRHLLFVGPQTFMFTPEEVENFAPVSWEATGNASAVCLGRSEWFHSFSTRHLDKCQHYRVMFYDEFLDIICERIEARDSGFVAA